MTSYSRASALFLALASASLVPLPALAEMVMLGTDLDGASQVPPVDTAATGTADVTVDTEAMTIDWTTTVEGLSGDPVAAHFHGPAGPEETAPPVIDVTANLAEGSAGLTEEQLAQVQAGDWYLNVHTEQYPDGEIRGQVLQAADAGTDAATE